jgi:signal recognition particle GTPase
MKKIPSPRDAYDRARKMYKNKSRQVEKTPRGFGQKWEQIMQEKKHADIMAKKEALRLQKKNEELRNKREFEARLAEKEKKDEDYKRILEDDFIVSNMGTDPNSFYRSISSIMYEDGGEGHNDIRELIAMTLETRYSDFPDIRTHVIVSRGEEVRKGKHFNTSSLAFSHHNCIW